MLEFSSTESCTTSNTSTPLVGFSSNDSSCDGNVALMNDFESTGGCSGQGPQGPDGFSAYQIAVFDGFVGTEEEWLASLVGPVGPGVPVGGTAGQILTKIDSTNYNTFWQDNYADWTSVVKHIVKNDGTGLILKGTPVYVTGSNGTNMLVGKASNISEATSSKTMGLMQTDITTTGGTQTGFVITEGLLAGLNTAGRTAGEPIWLGPNGTLIYGLINKPYAPAHLVFIGIVTKVSAGNGEVFVKVQNGFELKEIHDVDVITTTPVNGDVLGFNGSLWVNKTIPNWLGYTPFNLPTLTSGSVLFSDGTTVAQDNSNFFWNNTSKKLGIGTSTFVGSIKLAVNGQIGGPTYSSTYLDVTGAIPELRGNSGIGYYSSAGNHTFYGGSSVEYMRLTTAGNVGIGTTSPVSKLHIGTAPVASTNYGTLSIGGGAFNGSTAGYFIGSVLGTSLAINEVSGYGGNLLDLQVAGVTKLKVDTTGSIFYQTSSASGLKWDNLASIMFNGQDQGIVVTPYSTNYVGFSVKGRTSQTYDLQQWQNSIGTILAKVTATGNLGIGNNAPTARLQVKGDGTNPIARFETSTSAISQQFYDTSMIGFGNVNPVYAGIYGHSSIDPNTASTSSLGVGLISNQSSTTASYGFGIRTTNGSNAAQWITGTGGLIKFITSGFIPSAAGNGNYRNLEINYSLNGTNGAQTGTATGIFLNATETALNGMVHNLMDLQVGGVSKFRVSSAGTLVAASSLVSAGNIQSGTGNYIQLGSGVTKIWSPSDGVLQLTDTAATSFSRLQLGGTTSSYPAIKRNGAGIDFRLADDSGFCNINAGNIAANGTLSSISATTGQSLISSGLIVNNAAGGTTNDNFIVKSLLLPSLLYVDAVNNKIGINTATPSQLLDINGITQAVQFKLSALNTAPATAAATGVLGEIRIDSGYIYVCTATNSWKRIAIATW